MPELVYELIDNCPVCHSDRKSSMATFTTLKDSRIQTEGGSLECYYVACLHCGLIFHNPRFTEESWIAWYQKYYDEFIQASNQAPVSYGRQFVTTLARSLSQGPWLYDRIPKVTAHVDIGCQMDQLQREVAFYFGNSVSWGTEQSPTFRDAATAEGACIVPSEKDLPTHVSALFDLVTLSHSLEHFNDPGLLLRTLHSKYSAKNAYIFIEVPNGSWKGALQMSHPICFTKYTLKHLMAASGWEVTHMQYTGWPNSRIGRPFIRAIGKKVDIPHTYQVPKDTHWHLKRKLNKLWSTLMNKAYKSRWLLANPLGMALIADKRIHPDAIHWDILSRAQNTSTIRSSPIDDVVELYSGGEAGGRQVEYPPTVRRKN